jgi:hypothetical protein
MEEITAVVPRLAPQAEDRVRRGRQQRDAARDSADADALEAIRRRLAVLMDRPVA